MAHAEPPDGARSGRIDDPPLVRGVMSAPLISIEGDASVDDARRRMARYGVHHLGLSHAGRVVGVFSDHDLPVHPGRCAGGGDYDARLLREMLALDNARSATLRPDTSVTDAARLLVTRGLSALAVVDDDHRPMGIITARGLLRSAIRPLAGSGLLHDTANAAACAVFITDRDGTIEWVNDGFTALTGYDAAEAVGQNPRLLKSGYLSQRYYRRLWSEITAGRCFRSVVTDRRKDHSVYHARQTITVLPGNGDAISTFVAIQDAMAPAALGRP